MSQEFLPAGEVGETQREVRNPRMLFRARPLPRGRRPGHTSLGVTSPFYVPGMRGASRNLTVRSPPSRGARPRRTRRESSNAPRYNIPAGTNFRLLTDGSSGSGSPAYRLDATDALPQVIRSFIASSAGKGFPSEE